ncbi:BspA family leucine-rich repeat surface protein [Maribacter chungangensis]|uniref:BspA family leucine-rich repeat surface protein n=1 Tax=Maribacter chungangensis TaxID=1069117 RepID=A0ABW3B165_9FLAO
MITSSENSYLKKLLFFFYMCITTLNMNAQTDPNNDFVTTWKTDNPGAAISDATIIIPTEGEGYNYDVDWDNDGIFDDLGLTGDATHTYATPGTYTVRIRGTFPRFYLNNNRRIREKLLSIDQWGDIQWTSMESAFHGAFNMVLKATDAPNLENVSSMDSMFANARSFNQDINDWDVGNVTDMNATFRGASSYDQPMDKWNVSSVTGFERMFMDCSLFNQDISAWDVSSATSTSFMFRKATSFNQNINIWDVGQITDMSFMFDGAILFNQPLDNWNIANNTTTRAMFRNAVSFNQDLNNWDVGNVTDMGQMFKIDDASDPFGLIPPDAADSAFNRPLNNWNVGNISRMDGMFYGAVSFDQPLNDWDVRNVVNMEEMFFDALNFNQPLNGWDVGNVINMSLMFGSSPGPVFGGGLEYNFNQPLNDWDVGNVTEMLGMFLNSENFNQPLDNWDVGNVVNMEGLFLNAEKFNQNIESWNTAQVESMLNMFADTRSFNQPLNKWNVSNVKDMGGMFNNARAFNQPLADWDVSNVELMDTMFSRAISFNQSLATWNVTNATDMSFMFGTQSMTIENYDSLLRAWSNLTLQPNVSFGAGNATYCESEAARNSIIENFGWQISDGGLNCLPYTLPADNFLVLGTDVSCIDKSDGKISITAKLEQSYNATLVKSDFFEEVGLRDIAEFADLEVGNYTLCITVPGQFDFERCFEVAINQPESLSVSSKVNDMDNTVTLALKGAPQYFININEKSYTTSLPTISLPITAGNNTITVRSGLNCQGLFEEKILVERPIGLFPNPVSEGAVSVYIGPHSQNRNFILTVHNANGALVLHQKETAVNGKLEFDAKTLPTGIYFVNLKSPELNLDYKLVKR